MSSIAQVVKCGLAVLAVGVSLGAMTSAASAANRFGVICVKNETSFNIKYQFRVGKNGAWETRSMRPGEARMFSHKYDKLDENKSPPLFLSYDSDGRSNKKFNDTRELSRKAAVGQSCSEGSQYVFVHEKTNRDFLKLVRRD